MKQQFTRQEVIELINELLKMPDVLKDAVNNENTEYQGETLLDLVDDGKCPLCRHDSLIHFTDRTDCVRYKCSYTTR